MELDTQPDSLAHLTRREREVLGYVGQGLSIPEIAERMYRSQKTIETHRLSLGRKLNANNRVELARIAIRAGLAPLDDPDQKNETGDARDRLSAQSPAWHALRNIEASVATAAGPGYFRKLLTHLANDLRARCALIAEIVDRPQQPRQMRVLTNVGQGQIADPQTVAADSSLLALIEEQRAVRLEGDLIERFPDCPIVQKLRPRFFLAVRLDNARKQTIGVLALLHDQPLPAVLEPDAILSICASRAAVELERTRMEEQLREAWEHLESRVTERTEELEHANGKLRRALAQQERAESNLHQAQEKYLALVESMDEGLAVLDPQGRLVFVNQPFADLFGRHRDELLGRPSTDFLSAEQAGKFRSLYARRLEKKPFTYDLQVTQSDGKVRTLQITTRSLFDEQQRYIGSLGVARERPADVGH